MRDDVADTFQIVFHVGRVKTQGIFISFSSEYFEEGGGMQADKKNGRIFLGRVEWSGGVHYTLF